ncbi:MAG: queuosine precursor transporter [Gammaproteobacteria bacterium]|nr:queuosine precursor transporter [Gammaproteobacteria bacterium]MDH5277248.1 queuosine precursor transporter [Gammaproteobacteria bacterium]
MNIKTHRATRLFVVLAGIFIANAVLAEFVGIKVFAIETTFGLPQFNWELFGQTGTLNFTSGVVLWPVVFVLTDVVNEYYGRNGVRFLSFLAVGLISYAFVVAWVVIQLAPADWWTTSFEAQGVPDLQTAFAAIYGQGMWVIVGSLVAFLIGQLLDVAIFHRIRLVTGERLIWLRATGSTLVSQFVDSFVVLYIAFVLGPQHWPINQFLAIGTVNYAYKFLAALALTPLIYAAHWLIDGYLGNAVANELKAQAAADRADY